VVQESHTVCALHATPIEFSGPYALWAHLALDHSILTLKYDINLAKADTVARIYAASMRTISPLATWRKSLQVPLPPLPVLSPNMRLMYQVGKYTFHNDQATLSPDTIPWTNRDEAVLRGLFGSETTNDDHVQAVLVTFSSIGKSLR